jgi:alanine racemase
MSNLYRPTWAEINLDHLWHNVLEARKAAPGKEIIPVVKANAYGHGVIPIVSFLHEKGIRIFAVSTLEESLELRNQFKDIDILMMGPILEADLKIASKHHIQITLYDLPIIKAVLNQNLPLTTHLKIDTGMSRYGLVDTEDILKAIHQLSIHPMIDLRGIYTHFATSSEQDALYERQLERFMNLLDLIPNKPKMIHISNSSSIFKREQKLDFTTHVRLGISLYGLSLDNPKPDLKPVMSLKSKVVEIKSLKKGDTVGYGGTYQAFENERIAILPIGYADGFIRRNKTGSIEIRDKKQKIVGIICMDATFVKVDEDVQVGDIATLFGGIITIDDVAKRLNTITYEVITQVSYRVPRVTIRSSI